MSEGAKRNKTAELNLSLRFAVVPSKPLEEPG